MTAIPDYAFGTCDVLAEVKLHDGVTSIGSYAFTDCPALKEMTLPAGLEKAGERIFNNCTGLEKLTLPAKMTVQTTKRTGNAPVQSTTVTTTTTTTTTAALPAHTVFSKDKLECRVTTDGVEVSLDEKQLQTIDIDTEELLAALSDVKTELKASIIIDDIDLDGHDDLFIPQQVGTLNTFGVYYHYDDKDEKYVKWEELSEIDSRAEVNEENKTFTTDVKLSDDEYEVKVFEWKDGKPSVQTIKKQYKSAENKDELLIDYFDCSSGEKQLVKRERVLFDSEGRIAGDEEVELD